MEGDKLGIGGGGLNWGPGVNGGTTLLSLLRLSNMPQF